MSTSRNSLFASANDNLVPGQKEQNGPETEHEEILKARQRSLNTETPFDEQD